MISKNNSKVKDTVASNDSSLISKDCDSGFEQKNWLWILKYRVCHHNKWADRRIVIALSRTVNDHVSPKCLSNSLAISNQRVEGDTESVGDPQSKLSASVVTFSPIILLLRKKKKTKQKKNVQFYQSSISKGLSDNSLGAIVSMRSTFISITVSVAKVTWSN